MSRITDVPPTNNLLRRQSQKPYNVQKPDNDFIFPVPSGADGPNNAIFPIGSTLELKWATTMKSYDLIMYQQLPRTIESCPEVETNPGCVRSEYYIARNIAVKSYIWTVTSGTADTSLSRTFFLRVRPNPDTRDNGEQFGSSFLNFTTGPPLNLVTGLGVSTSSSLPTSLTISSTSVASTTIASLTVSTSPKSDQTQSLNSKATSAAVAAPKSTESAGLPEGAKIGIAIAVTALFFIAMAIGWFCWYKRRNRNQKAPETIYPELAVGEIRQYEIETHERAQELEARKQPGQVYEMDPGYVQPKEWKKKQMSELDAPNNGMF